MIKQWFEIAEYLCVCVVQVTVEYKYIKGAAVPTRVHTVVISAQHDEKVTMEQLRKELMEKVIKTVIPSKYLDERTVFHLQPSGKFIIGGPQVRRVCLVFSVQYKSSREMRKSQSCRSEEEFSLCLMPIS